MTGDSAERIYTADIVMRSLAAEGTAPNLLQLLHQAYESRSIVHGMYDRVAQDGSLRRFRIQVRYLTGDVVRSLFFITYQPITGGGDAQ